MIMRENVHNIIEKNNEILRGGDINAKRENEIKSSVNSVHARSFMSEA